MSLCVYVWHVSTFRSLFLIPSTTLFLLLLYHSSFCTLLILSIPSPLVRSFEVSLTIPASRPDLEAIPRSFDTPLFPCSSFPILDVQDTKTNHSKSLVPGCFRLGQALTTRLFGSSTGSSLLGCLDTHHSSGHQPSPRLEKVQIFRKGSPRIRFRGQQRPSRIFQGISLASTSLIIDPGHQLSNIP